MTEVISASTVERYYQILFWAVILYGVGVGLKLVQLLVIQKIMPVIQDQDHGLRKTRETPRFEAEQHIAWRLLALFWMINALLQVPPEMASMKFDAILRHFEAGAEPIWIRAVVAIGAKIWAAHPIGWNITSMIVQASIGFFLWTESFNVAGKVVLVLANVWAFLVWFFEGVGGLFLPRVSAISGWPGAGLLFIAASVLVWRKRGSRFLRIGWLIFWGLAAVRQALPVGGVWMGRGLTQLLPARPTGYEPSWVFSLIEGVKQSSYAHPVIWNSVWIVLFMLVGGSALFWRTRWSDLLVFGGLFWIFWVGQNFGMVPVYGLAINTAPLFGWMWWVGVRRSSNGTQPERSPAQG